VGQPDVGTGIATIGPSTSARTTVRQAIISQIRQQPEWQDKLAAQDIPALDGRVSDAVHVGGDEHEQLLRAVVADEV